MARKGDAVISNKPNLSSKDIWSVVLSAAATLLCAFIDLILKEDNQTK